MRLGGNGLINIHALLILRHVARVHEHLAIAHGQVERHVRIVGVGGISFGEDGRRRGVVLVVERIAALHLVDFGNPRIGLPHLVHVSVELGQLGRLGEILQRLIVILGLQRPTAQIEIAVGKRLLGRGHERCGLFAVQALVDHLFEFRGGAGEILGAVSGRSFVVDCSEILRRERYRRQQRDYRYE